MAKRYTCDAVVVLGGELIEPGTPFPATDEQLEPIRRAGVKVEGVRGRPPKKEKEPVPKVPENVTMKGNKAPPKPDGG